ncbi:MAG: alpha-N-arabinofuranosidase [Sedimentisphaerales bacterium]|nr:alpha-N-arabinofuranosidase [Sedimentisphaerales bacterium]
MNRRRLTLAIVILGLAGSVRGVTGITADSEEPDKLLVHTDRGKDRIAPEIYGHFAEHLGRCIYEGFWVGEDSDIPNTRGIRTDVVEALRQIRVPVLRWPGGCFADEYHWREGVGPREKRGKMINTHWGRVIDDHSFGTHEFLDLCEMLGCEAYVAGNVGSGTVEEMQDWVEYMTSDSDSDMVNLRRQNGRERPWRVRYFGVGNENWGCGGNMTPEYYADLYCRFQTYVRDYSGNRILKVACGPGSLNLHWMDVVMQKAARHMHAVSLHHYVRGTGNWTDKGSATRFDELEWFALMKNSLGVDDLIARNIEVMDKYDRRKRIALYVDEWGTWWDAEPGTNPGFLYQQNTLRDAVSAGVFLNVFNKYCRRVKMANIAQTNNVLQAMILTRGKAMIVTPTYHVFEMFKVHQDATFLPSDLTCHAYRFRDREIPGLVVSASKNTDDTVHVSICNLDPSRDSEFECLVDGMAPRQVAARVLTAEKMTAHNTFANPDEVKPVALHGVKVDGTVITAVIPAKSVAVLAIR